MRQRSPKKPVRVNFKSSSPKEQEVDLFFLNNANLLQSERIYDLGCGHGYFMDILQKYFPAKFYEGFDLDKSFCDIAESAHNLRVHNGDITSHQPRIKWILHFLGSFAAHG